MMDCPIHGTEMYYAWRQDLYACQLRDCEYSGGVQVDVLLSAIVPDRIPSTAKEGPQMTMREWAGRKVALQFRNHRTRFPMMILLNEESARKLALALGRLRQTYSVGLSTEVEEIYQALNYVLVADPHSVALHAQMEASKGMEPGDSSPPRHPRPLRETEINLAQPEPLTDPGLRAHRRRSGEFFNG